MKTYSSVIKRFKKNTVLVIGELIVDVYLQGCCSRISPEASVPVIDLLSKSSCLGGAANVAANLKAMGSKVLFCSVAGDDEGFNKAKELFRVFEISDEFLVVDPARQTLIKTRVGSTSQTMVRVDEGTVSEIDSIRETALIYQIKRAHEQCNAILIADYNKGIVSDRVLIAIEELQRKDKKFLAVDSKNLERFSFLKPDLVKPNYLETIGLLSKQVLIENRAKQIQNLGKELWEKTHAKLTAVSVDEDGVCFFENDSFLFHVPADVIPSPKVSGAGDTFISVCLLALVSNANINTAASLALDAATIAVQKENTAVCSYEELLANYIVSSKIFEKNLAGLCKMYHSQGKRIVFTNGCFDVLHSGHVSYLKGAKAKGDILIVGLNNDESVRRLKGVERPINSLEHRIAVLSELNCVDYVIPFGSHGQDNPIELIKKIKPDVFVKGADYEKKFMPERKILKEIGAEFVLLPLIDNQSTTTIIERIRSASMVGKLPLSS